MFRLCYGYRRLCDASGDSEKFKNVKKIYVSKIFSFLLKVCVEKCPDAYFYFDLSSNQLNFDDLKKKLICTYDTDKATIQNVEAIRKLINKEKCASYYISSLPSKQQLFV